MSDGDREVRGGRPLKESPRLKRILEINRELGGVVNDRGIELLQEKLELVRELTDAGYSVSSLHQLATVNPAAGDDPSEKSDEKLVEEAAVALQYAREALGEASLRLHELHIRDVTELGTYDEIQEARGVVGRTLTELSDLPEGDHGS